MARSGYPVLGWGGCDDLISFASRADYVPAAPARPRLGTFPTSPVAVLNALP